jgi:hypothetical protein
VTLPGMDPGTVRPVAQRLNHYATPGPILTSSVIRYYVAARILITTGIQVIFISVVLFP